MSCETEFKGVLSTVRISKSPSLEKALQETLDRILKSLDICNAVVNGIDSVSQSRRLAEIAVTALKQRPLCNGSVHRAKRALTSLVADGKDRNIGSGGGSNRRTTSRSWSFGQRSSVGGSSVHVSKNWSAAKQIQAMAANLVPPRGAEASGPAMPVYIMSSVTVLVMWVLVAAVPCQASNVLVAPLQLPKHQSWASAALNIQERVSEEMKRMEKRFGGGLMEEMERVGLSLLEFTERFRFPGEEEEQEELAEKVEEMDEICRGMEVGLEGLQRQVRVVFHRLVRSRLEIVSDEETDHYGSHRSNRGYEEDLEAEAQRERRILNAKKVNINIFITLRNAKNNDLTSSFFGLNQSNKGFTGRSSMTSARPTRRQAEYSERQ
ncbi:hypothetical protein Bca4012_015058 [Brassica carinata]